MKKLLKWCAVLTFLLAAVLACSISASAAMYEPDGTASTEYLFDAADCNRTLVVNCLDEGGTLIKQMIFQTKKGEEDIASFCLYGYDFYSFESTQGLWENCALRWDSGIEETHSRIWISYKFITGLSSDSITATVRFRQHDINVKIYHKGRSEAGIKYGNPLFDTILKQEYNISYGDAFTCQARNFIGYSLYTGSSFSVMEYRGSTELCTIYPNGSPSLISGPFRYNMLEGFGVWDYKDFMVFDSYYNDAMKAEKKEYTTYHEDEDGVLESVSNREIILFLYYNRNQYTVTFDSNGGTGSTDSIRQYYDMTITIPDFEPSRENCFFMGWSQSYGAKKASYVAGDTYTVKGNTTLYAVWDQEDYEFSAEYLTVYADRIYPNSIIQIEARTDSWDDDEAYTGIPVELYYDGVLLTTQYADFDVYGITWMNFYVDVGTVLGDHEIQVWINREGMAEEVDQSNNIATMVITVENDEYAFGITPIPNNAPYTEDTEVITSYLISNDSIGLHVYPDMETYVLFTTYYLDEYGEQIVIQSQNWNGLAIPYGESNLVWFKWRVPEGLAGKPVYCECSVNTDGALKENNRDNNTATLTVEIVDRAASQTVNPSFEVQKPGGYTPPTTPAESIGSASWRVWEYRDGAFSLVDYGIRIANNMPILTPGAACETAVYENGMWNMKSGYGVTMYYTPDTVSADGCRYPQEDAITEIQTVTAHFPEYGYSQEAGMFRSLELERYAWRFAPNLRAEDQERIHYIPVWIEDGEYTGSVIVEDFWTPAGMISCVRLTLPVVIEETVFDDYYVGV